MRGTQENLVKARGIVMVRVAVVIVVAYVLSRFYGS